MSDVSVGAQLGRLGYEGTEGSPRARAPAQRWQVDGCDDPHQLPSCVSRLATPSPSSGDDCTTTN